MSFTDHMDERFRKFIEEGVISLPSPIAQNWPVRTKIVASTPIRSGMDFSSLEDYSPPTEWPNVWDTYPKITKRSIKHVSEIERTFKEIHEKFPQVVELIASKARYTFLRDIDGFHELNHYYDMATIRAGINTHRRNVKYAIYAIYIKNLIMLDLTSDEMRLIHARLSKSIRPNSPARMGIFNCIKPFAKLVNKSQAYQHVVLPKTVWGDYLKDINSNTAKYYTSSSLGPEV